MHGSCRILISGDVCGTSPSAQHILRLTSTAPLRRAPLLSCDPYHRALTRRPPRKARLFVSYQTTTVPKGQNSQVARQERTSDTAKSDFPAELEVPGWRSRTCPSRGIQNKRERKPENPDLPTFHTPSADWRCRLVTSPFSVIFINMIPVILIDRGLRYRPSRDPRRAIAKTPVD